MSKRYDEPIEVTPDPAVGGAPRSFSWRGRRYDVDLPLTSWREAGEWWRGPNDWFEEECRNSPARRQAASGAQLEEPVFATIA